MSNIKVDRARKLDLGSNEMKVISGDSGHGHRRRAASCAGVFYSNSGSGSSCRRHVSSTTAGKIDASNSNETSALANSVNNSSTVTNFNNNNSINNNNHKRKYSFCDVKGNSSSGNKRRKKESIVPPTKFLLGGNINDPLNLNSFVDEKLGTAVPQLTPESSPMPTPKHRVQVEVFIPPNINDPLNLNGGEEADDLELNLVSPKTKKRKRKKKKVQSTDISQLNKTDEPGSSCQETVDKDGNTEKQVQQPSHPKSLPLHKTKRTSSSDKIVSPVIPQPTGTPRKRFLSGHNRSQSDSKSETACCSSSKRRKLHHNSFSSSGNLKKPDQRFIYGNYNRYYGYRNPSNDVDRRVLCFKKEWFEEKDVLDVGCNVGHVTFCVARDYEPSKIVGIDIDAGLIKIARRNVVHYLQSTDDSGLPFPISLTICHGPITAPPIGSETNKPTFPNNVCFVQCDYVPKSDVTLNAQKPEYDTILCLSVTKWIHLNWGDEGLKRMFKRMYKQLRPGGKLILEPQAWTSYSHRKKMSDTTLRNFNEIKFKPEMFTTYLLSKEVGFSTCEMISVPFNAAKGFRRPIQLFTKSEDSSSACN
ncbi:hypothetical protein CHUAL_000734 [Chamberlinius hualienensis]